MASKVVGLTGGIGSGKSAAAALFAECGVAVIDTDLISHQLTRANGQAIPDIIRFFGSEFVSDDGSLNRKRMRELVFADADAKSQLEAVLHPLIFDESVRQLADVSGHYAILVVPLLFEHPAYLPLLSRALVIDCEESVQVARVMSRSHLDEPSVRAIMAAQMPRLQRCTLANDIIHNNHTLDDLRLQVEEKHRYYLASLV